MHNLCAAVQRKDRCLSAPATIKGAALSNVSAKLAKLGLAREIEAKSGAPIWRRDDAGQGYALKLTAAGLKAIGVDEGSQDAIEPGKAPQPESKDRASPDEGGHPARAALTGLRKRGYAVSRLAIYCTGSRPTLAAS
jgi:hypothetical protein